MSSPSNRYLQLIERFPLRPLRTARDHAAAMAVVARLAVEDESRLTVGERDYLEALSVLIEDYDRRHATPSSLTAAQLLRHLMESHGLSISDLGRIIGSQPNASLIASGKRPMSRAVMLKLGEHFGIDPGLFLRGDGRAADAA